MKFTLEITPAAEKGIKKIRKSGDRGKLKQVQSALEKLADNPAHPGLNTHRMKPEPRFGNRDDLWISYIRIGPGGERILWAYGEQGEEVKVIEVEYVGRHID
jgi:mRNA-degrading endonuclease RelE of RelBE toxin-antitoxin system